MPYTIQRDGREFCVHKRNTDDSIGEQIACHDSRQDALAQIAALEVAEQEKTFVKIFKEGDTRFMLLVSSNAYEDREQEIIAQKALKGYVEKFKPTPLLFWHGGDPIGKVVKAQMVGAFLVEVAKEIPNRAIDLARGDEEAIPTTVKDVWDVIENESTEWGASIGFKFHKGDEQDGVYDEILKFETSILPRIAAANAITNAVVFTN